MGQRSRPSLRPVCTSATNLQQSLKQPPSFVAVPSKLRPFVKLPEDEG